MSQELVLLVLMFYMIIMVALGKFLLGLVLFLRDFPVEEFLSVLWHLALVGCMVLRLPVSSLYMLSFVAVSLLIGVMVLRVRAQKAGL